MLEYTGLRDVTSGDRDFFKGVICTATANKHLRSNHRLNFTLRSLTITASFEGLCFVENVIFVNEEWMTGLSTEDDDIHLKYLNT